MALEAQSNFIPDSQLQLIALDEGYLPRFIELIRHPELNPYLPFSPNYSEAQAREMMAVSQNRQNGCFAWMMITQQDLEQVGVITAMPVFHGQCLQIGYWVDPAHQGKGYASLAAQMVCLLAFDRLGCQRVQAQVVVDNTASVRVLEKAGFSKEGTLKASYQLNGKVVDTDMYAKVKS